MKRVLDPLRLDVATFTQESGELAGEWPGASLTRLAESQAPPQDLALEAVSWQVKGERRPVRVGEPEIWLALSAQAQVWLTCQRCLQPMALGLTANNRIRFVRGEVEAESLDAEQDEDVLALPRWLDLRELIEDELLLALPLVPRHGQCPQPLPMSAGEAGADGEEAEAPPANPFAALQALKSGRGGTGQG